jgi:hypothetical protein
MPLSFDIAQQSNQPIPPSVPAVQPVVAVAQQTSEQGSSDTIGAVVTGGSFDGLSLTYNSVTRLVSGANTDKGSTALAAHVAEADPHPQYLTPAEGALAFAPLVHTHTAAQITDLSEAVDDRVAALLVAGPNVTLTYNDASNTLTIESTGGGGGGGGGSDPWTYVSLGADHTNNTLTTTVVPTLQVTPSSSGTWIIEGMLICSTTNAAAMPRLTSYMPDNATGAATVEIQHGGTTSLIANNGTGAVGNFTAVGSAYAATGILAQVSACFVSTAAATVAFRLGLVSETAGETVTVLAGSWLRYRKVGAGGGGGGGSFSADEVLAIGALT